MAKRRTYEEKLLDQLNELPAQKWFMIKGREDFAKITATVKAFISVHEPFEFSNCYTKIRRLSDEWIPSTYHQMKKLPMGVTVQKIEAGTIEPINHKGTVYNIEHTKDCYRVYCGERLIAIE